MAHVQEDGVHARVVQRMSEGPHFKVVNQQVHYREDGKGERRIDSGKGERPEVLIDWHPAGNGKGGCENA